MKKTICAVSDTHGLLPDTFPCDLLIIAGDVCPTTDHNIYFQAHWLNTNFYNWLINQPAENKVVIFVNHVFVPEKKPELIRTDLMKFCLQNETKEVSDFKVFGSPYTPRFFDWSFNLDEPELEKKWKDISEGTDIVVTHGPPFGYGDKTQKWVSGKPTSEMENAGSPSLMERLKVVRPKLHISGHIHPGFGVENYEGMTIANVSHVNEKYKATNLPTEIILDYDAKQTIVITKQIINNKDFKTKEHVITW